MQSVEENPLPERSSRLRFGKQLRNDRIHDLRIME
jgi:hypothetical protein